ncbi:MAG: cysteine desulfurase [Hyphomicrobiales bacterium]|nr:cysteine desulfurase [Hyphomicrobiales bacterium]
MARERVYLDYNATAPVLPAAREAVVEALAVTGNPSSIHAEGRAARTLVERAREHVAALVGAPADRVYFTSGGTEAAVLALQPALAGERNRLLIAAGEHPCVLQGHGYSASDTRAVGLQANGTIDLKALQAELSAAGDTPVTLALQAANNETGAIQPLAEAAGLVHSHGGAVVCDAVQAAGRMDCSAMRDHADFIVLSGHKMGGIKGAGALICVSGLPDPNVAMIRGGGQERGMRAGTENVSAIAAFGAAAAWAAQNVDVEWGRLASLRDRFERELIARFTGAVVFAASAPRLANTSSFAIPGVSAETMLIALDLAGLAVSSGSACSSGKVKSSHVLDAMGVDPKLAGGAIRVSLGYESRDSDIDALLAGIETTLSRMKRKDLPAALSSAA